MMLDSIAGMASGGALVQLSLIGDIRIAWDRRCYGAVRYPRRHTPRPALRKMAKVGRVDNVRIR